MLDKIKEFFRNLVNSNKNKYIEAPKNENKDICEMEEKKDYAFKSQIVLENEGEERALKLQKDFKSGLIEEEDLSEEDFNLLTNLYEKQIEKTKHSIEAYKARIISAKSKLAQNG